MPRDEALSIVNGRCPDELHDRLQPYQRDVALPLTRNGPFDVSKSRSWSRSRETSPGDRSEDFADLSRRVDDDLSRLADGLDSSDYVGMEDDENLTAHEAVMIENDSFERLLREHPLEDNVEPGLDDFSLESRLPEPPLVEVIESDDDVTLGTLVRRHLTNLLLASAVGNLGRRQPPQDPVQPHDADEAPAQPQSADNSNGQPSDAEAAEAEPTDTDAARIIMPRGSVTVEMANELRTLRRIAADVVEEMDYLEYLAAS